MPYVALDQAPVPTETPAGFDFHAALTDYDTWEKGLPQQQRDILQRRFALSDDVEADRRRFLSVGYVAQATGHPVKDVSEQFENWYMPGFAKSPKGLALTAAPADVNGFFGELTKKVRSDKVSRDLDRQAASSAFQAALAGEDVVSSLAAFQAGNKELMPSHSQTFRTQYEAVNATLAPYRQTVQDVIEAMKAELQTESTGGAITQADTPAESAAVARLVELKKSDPKGYKLVAAALTKAAQSAPKEQKGGEVDPATNVITRWLTGLSGKTATAMGQKLGESAFRGARDIIGGATEAVAVAGANVADTVGDMEAAKTLRAQADVNRDLRDIQNGVLDPIKAAQDGFLGELEAGLYAGAQSAPTMLAAMSPAGRGLLVGSYASDAYAKFRQNGWEGQDAEAMALGVGVFSAAVESASEVVGYLPGIKQGLAKMGMTPGSGWVTQFALRSAGRGGVEFGEEFLQDMAATAAQQWGSAVFEGIPDTPQGQRLSDEYKQWTSRANMTALAVAVLPLGMLGAGVSMRQEMGSIDYLTQDKERVAALLGEEAAAKITAIPDAQKRADEFTAAYQAQAETERIANLERAAAKEAETEEASKAVDELTRRGGYTLTRSDDGWTVTTPDNKTVKTERAGEAVALMARDFSEAELRNASAVADMADAFLMQKRGGESVEVNPGKARDIQDDVTEGRITPESAREAIVTAGRLAGLTEAESMQQIGAVLGSSTIEENEGVREAVGRIYRGANAMTVVEETIEGRWTRGLETKRYKPQQGETWVRMAEQATGETYLPADYSARDLVEAISFIVKADVLGRRKDGARLAPGLVSRGVREAAMQGSKDAGKFAAFLSSFRALFKRVFSTARKLAAARAEGKIDQDWENLMDDLLGLDSQARYENSVAKETWKIIEIEGINKSQSEYDHLIQKVAAISDAAQREPTHAIIERHKDVLSNLEKLGVKLDTKTAEVGVMSVQIDENGEISLNIDPRYTAATESVGLSDQAVFHEAVHAAQAVFDGKNTALSKAADATFDPTSPNFDRTLDMFMAKEVPGWAKIQGTRNAKYEAVRAIIEAKRLGKTSRSFMPEMPFTKYLRAFTAWVKNHVFNTTLTKGSEFAEYVRQIDAMVGELQGSVTREASDWVDPDSLAYTPKDGESFSLGSRVTQDQDTAYLQAVQSGDMTTAQRMVDEAAKAAGYNYGPLFHSRLTPFTVFQKYGEFMGASGTSGIHLTDNEQMARRYLDRYAEYGWLDGKPNQRFQKEVIRVYAKIENPLHRQDPFQSGIGLGAPLPANYTSPVERLGYDALIREEAISSKGPVKHVQYKNAVRGKEIILFTPEHIKSADPVTRDDQGNVIPLSQRFNSASDSINYSLAPRSLAARVQSAAEKKMGDPEFRAKVFQEMQRRLGALREDSTFHNFGRGEKTVAGMDAAADRDRSIASLEREAKFRQRSAEREAVQTAMDALPPSTLLAYERGLQSIEDHPLVHALLNDVGKLMSRTTAAKQGKKFVGEYDGAPWLPPSWYDSKGGVGPDVAAQSLYTRGLINSPSPDSMWDALRSVIDNARMANEEARAAKQQVREIHDTAFKQSSEMAEKWFEDARAKIPSQQERLIAALRTLDAMTSVLPAEVRGKLGGVTKLASLKTDEARARALLEKLDKADAELEKYMQKDFREQLAEMVKTVRKTGKGGEKAMGKIGVAGHRWFDQVTDAVAMTEQAAQDEMAKQEAIMIDPNRTEEEQGAAFETWGILHQFGGFNEKSAAEMSTAVQAARQVAKNGREAWNMILAERKRERQALQSQALEALGGMVNIADIQQGSLKASQKAEAKSLKHWFDQHFTFQQLLDTIFGPDAKVARYFEQKARKATQVKTDAMIARLREYKAAMLDATGATTWKKAQDALYALHEKNENAPVRFFADSTSKTIDVSSDIVERLISGEMDAKAAGLTQAQVDELEIQWSEAVAESQDSARKRTFKVEQNTEGRALGRTSISQLEAVHFTMLARQEQYRKAMERHGITAESLSDIEAWLTPEAKAVRSWLFSQYDKGYGSLNEVYKRMFGIDMPRVREYAPGYFESEGKVTDLDPFGTGIEATGMAAGFLKKRKQHLARPVQVDALQAYWQHVQQVEHWKAWAEVTSEMRAVLANKDVLLTVRAKTGEGNARDVLSWVDAFEKNGVKDAQASVMLSKIMRAQARIALAYKVGVLMKQLPAMLGSLSDISAIQWAQSASRVLAGQGQMPMAEMWKNPVIQRRVESGYSPEMRSAMRGPTAKPDFMGDVLEYGMQAISKTDAAFTTFSASVAYDAHYRAAIESGANPQQAAQIAMEQTEQTIGRTAQPVELMDRSLIEMKATGLGKLMFMFQSAQRQSWALSYAAATGLVKGNVSKADASRVLFTQFVLIPSITQTMAGLVRYLFSDDEPEELWKPADYARAMLLGPSSGIMFFGAMLDVLGSKFSPRSNNPLSNALGDVKRLYDDWQNERDISANDVGSAVAGASLLLSGVVPGSVESVGVTWSILKQILGITERVEKGP